MVSLLIMIVDNEIEYGMVILIRFFLDDDIYGSGKALP